MGKPKPVLIGRFEFDTKTAATKYVQEILNTATWGDALTGANHEFVFSLLYRHPSATEKVGCGIQHFTVNNDNNGCRCFYIHRTDGTNAHFSYLKSLKGRDDLRSLVLGAIHRAIDEQIWAFRDKQLQGGPLICCYTQQPVTRDSCHVDHLNPTFLELYTAWMARERLVLEDLRVSDGSGNEVGRRMTDSSQRDSWQEYHRKNAQLRMLSPLGNLSAAKIEANRRIRETA